MMNQAIKEEEEEGEEGEEEDECAVMLPIKVLGRKWIPCILCELLSQKNLHFSDLLKQTKGNDGGKISARVLSESLRRLEDNQIVVRTVISDTMPIRVKYSLTERGEDFRVIFGIMKGWAIKWVESTQKCRSPNCIHTCVPSININKVKDLFEKNSLYSSH